MVTSLVKTWAKSYCTGGCRIDSLKSTKAASDEGAASAMHLHSPPHGPEYLNEVVSVTNLGAKPAALKELTDTGPDANSFHITETYCRESVHITHKFPAKIKVADSIYEYGLQDHVFSDRQESKKASAGNGWLRFNERAIPPGTQR